MSFLDRTLTSLQKKEVIIPYLEEALMKNDFVEAEYQVKVFNGPHKYSGYFHPSSDITAGDYQLYYKFHPKLRLLIDEEKISPTSQMTFQVGSAFHAIIQSMLIHLGFTTIEDVEVKFRNEEHNVSGMVDVLNLTLPNGDKYLIDIKSANRLPNEASYLYAMQLRIYQDLCPGAPEKMALLFIEKTYPHRMKEIVVEKDDVELQKIYDKWDRVRVAINTGDTKDLKRCCGDITDEKYLSCPARHICKFYNP